MKIENAANTEPLYWTFEALSQMDEGDHYNHIKRLREYYYNVLTDVSPEEAKTAKLDLTLLNQEIEDMGEILRFSA